MTAQPTRRISRTPRWPRFSLKELLFGTVLVAVLVANLISLRQIAYLKFGLADLKAEVNAQRPLSVQEVASQFHDRLTTVVDSNEATRGRISVSVRDVRYSPTEDSYKVNFSWTDATANKTWVAEVILQSDGYGAYHGLIRNETLVSPLGSQKGVAIEVRTPSPLSEA